MRRLSAVVLATGLLAVMAGTAAAAPNRSASLWACTTSTGLHLQADWSGWHPDTLVVVSWESGSTDVSTFGTTRDVQWKFGTSSWDTSFAAWSANTPAVTFDSATMVAVDLYGHGKQLDETNAVMYGDLAACP